MPQSQFDSAFCHFRLPKSVFVSALQWRLGGLCANVDCKFLPNFCQSAPTNNVEPLGFIVPFARRSCPIAWNSNTKGGDGLSAGREPHFRVTSQPTNSGSRPNRPIIITLFRPLATRLLLRNMPYLLGFSIYIRRIFPIQYVRYLLSITLQLFSARKKRNFQLCRIYQLSFNRDLFCFEYLMR